MYQPIRASSSERSSGSRRLRSQVVAIRHRSSRKYSSTAAIVPSWVTAVNAAPGSSQPRKAGTIRRCPVLEIGQELGEALDDAEDDGLEGVHERGDDSGRNLNFT